MSNEGCWGKSVSSTTFALTGQVLTTITTREPYRRKGAAGLILEWALARAKKAGLPAYLEAGQAAKKTYEKHGFREVGVQRFEVTGTQIEIARMKA